MKINPFYFNGVSRTVVASLFTALLISACSNDDKSKTDDPESFSSNVAPMTLVDTSIGSVYTANQDLTLYTFENDTVGVSNCNDECAEIWPPLFAEDEAVAEGEFSIISRDDGSLQWAFKGYPLYFYYLDEQPGDVVGEGINDIWYVARPNPWQEAEVNDTTSGLVFRGKASVTGVTSEGAQDAARIDREGFTLYTFEGDSAAPGASSCNGMCASVWPPLYADSGAKDSGDFSVIERDDGSLQWAYRDYPLYFYAVDSNPGETKGHGITGAGDLWYVARPDAMQIQSSAIGSLLVGKSSVIDVLEDGSQASVRRDREGYSLYTFDSDTVGSATSVCNGMCANVWPPLYAEEGARTSALMTLVNRDDGSLQWAYKGRPLYFFKNDLNPGETNGDNIIGAGNLWYVARNAPVQRSPETVEGDILVARGVINDVDAEGERADTESDKTGYSLYTFDSDVAYSGESSCVDSCAVDWPPLYADDNDLAGGDFSVIERSDGSLQWTFEGLPLYFFDEDLNPGDLNGVYPGWSAVAL